MSIYIMFYLTEDLNSQKRDFKEIILYSIALILAQYFTNITEDFAMYKVENDVAVLKSNYMLLILTKALRINHQAPNKNFIGNIINLI